MGKKEREILGEIKNARLAAHRASSMEFINMSGERVTVAQHYEKLVFGSFGK